MPLAHKAEIADQQVAAKLTEASWRKSQAPWRGEWAAGYDPP